MCFSVALSEYTDIIIVRTLYRAAKEGNVTILRCFQDIKAMKVNNPNYFCY